MKLVFYLFLGQFMLIEPLMMGRPNSRKSRQARETDVFVLTIRAYDLGVPVMFSTATIRVYPPESKTRTVNFVLPGRNIDRKKTEEILSTITGGRVIIHDIQPYSEDRSNGGGNSGNIDGTNGGASNHNNNNKDMSVVTATVLYDSNSVVDISQIKRRLQLNNSTSDISIRDNAEAEVSNRKLTFFIIDKQITNAKNSFSYYRTCIRLKIKCYFGC